MEVTPSELFKKMLKSPNLDEMTTEEKEKYFKEEFIKLKKENPQVFGDIDIVSDNELLNLHNSRKGKSVTEIVKITGLSKYKVKSRLIE